jgi:hypothetical protein
MSFEVKWIDGEREPTCVPDLRYPDGVDLDVTGGKEPACVCSLPYPAKRCGHYYIECKQCGVNALITTAGRIDDPKSIKLPCKAKGPTKVMVAPHAKQEAGSE